MAYPTSVNGQITDSVTQTQPTEVNGAVIDAVHVAVHKAVSESVAKSNNARLFIPLYVITLINTICLLYLMNS